MIYSDHYPSVNLIRDDPKSFHDKSVLTKVNHWAYECERRIIEHEKGAGVYNFPAEDLKEIIFGMTTDTNTVEEVKGAINFSECRPRLLRAERHPLEFKLTLSEITD